MEDETITRSSIAHQDLNSTVRYGTVSDSFILKKAEIKYQAHSSMSALPPPPATPQVYMTPQLQKRRDGLAPSLLELSEREPQDPKTSLIKSYQTSSKYLATSVINCVNVDDSQELQKIVDSIATTLEALVDRASGTKDLASMKFQATGCKWTLDFNPTLRAESHMLEVVCLACEGGGASQGITYIVDTSLVSKKKDSLKTENLAGFKPAKAALDHVALQVRKAVVKCEFPDFPEGCKGVPFRDIYQLNARVSSPELCTWITITQMTPESHRAFSLFSSSLVHLLQSVVVLIVLLARRLPSSVC